MAIIWLMIASCGAKLETIQADVWIQNGKIIDGTGAPLFQGSVAIKGDQIVFVGQSDTVNIIANTAIDAQGLIVSPGFIDPHTHSLGDLKSKSRNSNINYLTQGVTTVFVGNDGEGPSDIEGATKLLEANKIGTNVAFFVGHGTVREQVMSLSDAKPDADQLDQMRALIKNAMVQGAYGLSTGLYYSPGSFAQTEEVIELSKEIAPFGGVYDSHIRDESSYNIGLIESVKETLLIGKMANVPVHFAHIKALGADVWKKSDEVIKMIETAQSNGQKVTADQYPWRFSGTHLENALINRWVMAGSKEAYLMRLSDDRLLDKIRAEVKENIRKRGGAQSLLVTADCKDETMLGKNLQEISEQLNLSPVEAALHIARNSGARVASFNMDSYDVENFMRQPWVMTCSDGTKGHPRKYASFPKKYESYVLGKNVLDVETFVHRSSGLVAATFGLDQRGILKNGYFADIIIWAPDQLKPKANISNPEELSEGIQYAFVNGQIVINGQFNGSKVGKVLLKNR